MKGPRLLALAAILVSGTAAPALAAWDRIGSVDVSSRNGTQVAYENFGGRVESLALRARDADVMCRNVTATFGNGQTADIFHGVLPRGRNVTVDLPGNTRMIRRVDFDCRAQDRGNAQVEISADVGRYQAEWRHSPDWDRVWSRVFPWANDRGVGNDRYVTGQLDTSGWIPLASQRFEGRRDHSMAFTGWRGRDLTSIALRPVNDDARCTNVTATFANGRTRELNLGSNFLRRDRMMTIDLPGDRRDVTRIDMSCHAEHGDMVTIQVLASK